MADVIDLFAPRPARRPPARARPDDSGDRLAHIRASLDKINRLMAELRRLAAGATEKSPARGEET